MNTIQQAHILLVDDNTDLLRLLEEQLRGAGYQNIRTVQNCAAAQTAFAAEMPELMILDINLPDGDGFSLFRTLRAKADVPTLFLSARDADADRLFGLGLGADDYLTKPFLMQELLLRVQHLLQRAYRTELSRTKAAILQLGDRSVDLHDALVTLPDGTTLALTATERTLLRKLAENRGHIVTYDALCEAVWGADYYGYENKSGCSYPASAGKAGTGAGQAALSADGEGHRVQAGKGGCTMKTFVRLIRRYVLAAVGIVLLLVFLGLGLLVLLGWQETTHLPQRTYASSEIADAMVETPAGLALGAAHTPEEWMDGYAWAMVLDDTGHIRWSYALPDALNHAYTTGEVAGFARWYLDDYPVFCWAEDYGLFVIGLARGSLWKYSIYTSPEYILNLAKTIPLGFGLLLLLAAICCFLLSWQGAKRLETVASGLDALAEGQTVQLPTEGFAGELAEKLNRTSAQLQTRNELLARRDDARTQWIAGVSHDVRTPLALILGWAEQLERDAVLPETARQKAGGIRTQSEKLRTLIEDLNLTSKLEYGTQPLRKQEFAAGPLFRELVAQFCESPQAETCEVSLQQTAAAEQAKLCVDRALLERLLENLLGNSIRHNAAPVEIEVQTDVAGNRFCLTVADNGTGYPPAVLAALQGTPQNEQTPHILGLHVVEQIAAAHGGRVAFGQNVPNGAKATVWLPLDQKAPVAFGQNVVK